MTHRVFSSPRSASLFAEVVIYAYVLEFFTHHCRPNTLIMSEHSIALGACLVTSGLLFNTITIRISHQRTTTILLAVTDNITVKVKGTVPGIQHSER